MEPLPRAPARGAGARAGAGAAARCGGSPRPRAPPPPPPAAGRACRCPPRSRRPSARPAAPLRRYLNIFATAVRPRMPLLAKGPALATPAPAPHHVTVSVLRSWNVCAFNSPAAPHGQPERRKRFMARSVLAHVWALPSTSHQCACPAYPHCAYPWVLHTFPQARGACKRPRPALPL